jgi:sulfur carrier protein ThiS
MSKKNAAPKGGRGKSANVAFGVQKDVANEAPDVDVDSEGEEEDRSGWVEFTDPEAKRRVVELETVSDLLKKLHFNEESGLINVIGPTLGFLDTDFVISRDGEILGRASKVSTPLPGFKNQSPGSECGCVSPRH